MHNNDPLHFLTARLAILIPATFVLGVMTTVVYSTASPLWIWSGIVAVITLLLTLILKKQAITTFQLIRYLSQIIQFFTALAVLATFAFGVGFAQSAMQVGLNDRLKTPETVTATVRVIGLSDGVDENWRQVVEPVDAPAGLPRRWLLFPKFSIDADHRRPVVNLLPGELWRVHVKLTPIHGLASPGAFDQEQWLLTQHVGAMGTLESADLVSLKAGGSRGLLDNVDRFREHLRNHLANLDSPARAMLLGLLTGDSALIDPDLRQLYQNAGISHLMAISGPHVVLAAVMFAWVLQQILNRRPKIYLHVPRKLLLLPMIMLIVVSYALLAGWGVSTQRTVLMTGIACILTLRGRQWSTPYILLLALAISLLIDPLAVYQSGLWLSFVATAILIAIVKQPAPNGTLRQRLWQHFKDLIKLQSAMFVLLIPVTLAFFYQIPLFSIVVNLIAIPLIGLVVVPLALIALLIWPLWTGLADAIWILAAWVLEQLHALLQLMPLKVFYYTLTPAAMLGWALAILIWLAPKGSLPRWLILPCLLPCLFPLTGIKPLFGAHHDAPLQVQVLDVGQGLAVLIQTSHHVMLYDAGSKRADAREGMGERVVLPALSAASVFHLDKLLISHGDFEHNGGVDAVRARLPVDELTSSQPFEDIPTTPCVSGQHWQWDGVDFAILAPWVDSHPFDNKDLSCVLRIRTPLKDGHRTSILFMGDAGTDVEARLLQAKQTIPDSLSADVLVFGDHGSDRASSDAFLQAVAPKRGVISTSFDNKEYPAPEVLARLAAHQVAVDSTVTGGTVTYSLGGRQAVEVSKYRDKYVWLKQ